MLVAVKGLIDVGELRDVWRVGRFEFGVAMVAFAGVLLLGILKGLIVAVRVSMLLLIRRAAHPHVAFIGRNPGIRIYSVIERNAVWQQIRSNAAPLGLVVSNLSSSPVVD
ncbi:Sulfate transporter [Candidatus Accumulibacter phosphatis]|uniref:Sulfate transporter n=1 Tax=Candidatus Accumulibacter phosphatis TaxID=327160 RepID=A0A5S4EM20_9PROT|nr:Sulfate transporter [Candidatus Accumulibacter phosphatis]